MFNYQLLLFSLIKRFQEFSHFCFIKFDMPTTQLAPAGPTLTLYGHYFLIVRVKTGEHWNSRNSGNSGNSYKRSGF